MAGNFWENCTVWHLQFDNLYETFNGHGYNLLVRSLEFINDFFRGLNFTKQLPSPKLTKLQVPSDEQNFRSSLLTFCAERT